MSSATNYNKLTVVQLKKELTERSLSTSGLKADLVARLTAHEESKKGTPVDGDQSEKKEEQTDQKEEKSELAEKSQAQVEDTQAKNSKKSDEKKEVEAKTPLKKSEPEQKKETKQTHSEQDKSKEKKEEEKEKKEEKEHKKTEDPKQDDSKQEGKVAAQAPHTPTKSDSKEDSMEVDKENEDKKRKTPARDARSAQPGSTAKRQRMWENDPAPASDISINSEVLKDVLIQNKQDDSETRHDRSTNGSSKETSTAQQGGGAPRSVAPSRKPVSRVLHIRGFVRPFTVKQVESFLSQEGELENLWMNSVKSECYATFKTDQQASATRNAITNTIWPPTNPTSRLHADFAREEEAKQAAAASAPRTPKTPVAPARVERTPVTAEKETRVADLRGSAGLATRTMIDVRKAATEREGERERERDRERDRERERDIRDRDRDRDRRGRDREPPKEKKFVLEDLFHKTQVKPHIYWVALTDAEVQKKTEAT